MGQMVLSKRFRRILAIIGLMIIASSTVYWVQRIILDKLYRADPELIPKKANSQGK